MNLQAGENIALPHLQATVTLQWTNKNPAYVLDASAYLLAANGKVTSDADFLFYGQPSIAQGAAVLDVARAEFVVDLNKIPMAAEKLAIALTVEDGVARRQNFAALEQVQLKIRAGDQHLDFVMPTASMVEVALILGEFYRRNGSWKFRALGQGFTGGLAALAGHFGVDISQDQTPSQPEALSTPVPSAAPINLGKVVLTKPNEKHTVTLEKHANRPKSIVISAEWVDNGDGDDSNDDLDLRVGILRPDGRMSLIHAPKHVGAFDKLPYVKHHGDVRVASVNAPATETVEVNSQISLHMGGPVALVLSVYSAVSNGCVDVASLRPKMRVQYGAQIIECGFDFKTMKIDEDDDIYTYVIGTVLIDGDSCEIKPSGVVSESDSEATPWLRWSNQRKAVSLSFDGPAVFKDLTTKEEEGFNRGNPNKYV